MSDEQRAAWQEACREVEAELPDLIVRNRLATAAAAEATVSGELRRAIHAGPSSLEKIADCVGVSVLELDQFLTGERSLPSHVMDRLAAELGYELKPVG